MKFYSVHLISGGSAIAYCKTIKQACEFLKVEEYADIDKIIAWDDSYLIYVDNELSYEIQMHEMWEG